MYSLIFQYRDVQLQEKWAWLQHHLDKVFQGQTITPAINHGDLCVANCGQAQEKPGTTHTKQSKIDMINRLCFIQLTDVVLKSILRNTIKSEKIIFTLFKKYHHT